MLKLFTLRGLRVPMLSLMTCMSFASTAAGQWNSSDGPAQATPETIEELIAQHAVAEEPGASVAIIKDGALIFSSAFGKASLEHDIDVTPETVFNVASVSKQFTAYAILLLVEQKKISLDDPVQQYLPEISGFNKPIALHHLIHHTSGLRDDLGMLALGGWRHEDLITNQHVLDLVSRQSTLDFEPGSRYMYSNTNYSLLASVVERVTGVSFADWTAKHILEPVGMTHTQFVDSPETIIPLRATNYGSNEGTFVRKADAWYNVGPGSLYTTALDLAKWVVHLQSGEVNGKPVLNMMGRRGVLNDGSKTDYAFGLVHGFYEGLKTIDHGGSGPGTQSSMMLYPDQEFASVVLSNRGGGTFSAGAMNRQIAPLYLASALAEAKPPEETGRRMIMITTEDLAASPGGTFAADPNDFDDYSGTYELELEERYQDDLLLSNLLIVSRDGDRLLMAFGEPPGIPMAPVSENRFLIPQLNFEVTFQKDNSNTVNGLLFHITEASFGDNPVLDIRGIKHAQKDLTSDELNAYAGAYYSRELETIYRITIGESGQLHISHPRHGSIPLVQLASDEFLADTHIFTNVSFIRDGSGAIHRVRLKGFSWSSYATFDRVELE